MLITTQQGELDLMSVIQTALKVAGAFASTLKLFQNDFAPTRFSVAADFTEATFTGYAAVAQAWAVGPYVNGAGQVEMQSASHNWTPTDGVNPNTIYGWYLVATGGDVICAQRFDNPRAMLGPTNSLTLLPSLIIIPGGIAGNVQPIDA